MTNIAEKVAVVTGTFYNLDDTLDQRRAEIALRTIRTAVELGHPTVVVDSSPDDSFRATAKDLGAIVEIETDEGMGPSRRQAMRRAQDLGTDVLAWTEPEKEGYIPHIRATAEPILDSQADLVVPRRPNLDSYPIAQQLAEPLGNLAWRDLTGADLDMWFGPRTWARDETHFFTDYNGAEQGNADLWDAHFIPVLDALHAGRTVMSINVPYTHPAEQKKDETGNVNLTRKRIAQLENLVPTLIKHWRKLKRE